MLLMLAGLTLTSCQTSKAPAKFVYTDSESSRTLRFRKDYKGLEGWFKDSTGTILPCVFDAKAGGYYRDNLK